MIKHMLEFQANNPELVIWIVPVFAAIHETEEWNILKWYNKHFKQMPPSTDRSIRLHILTLITFLFILTAIMALLPCKLVVSPILAFMTTAILVNTIQHILWTVQYRDYSPGLITALLCSTLTIWVSVLLFQEGLVIPLFSLISLIGIGPVLRTLRSQKGIMTKDLLRVHLFFIKLDRKIFGQT